MDDFAQLIFFALFVLFALLAGRKKKRPAPPRRRPRPPSVEPPEHPEVPPPRRIEEYAPPVPNRMGGDVVDEIFDLLRGRVPETREPEPEVPEFADEAKSLETLVPAGRESHRVFHEQYIDVPRARPPRTVSPRERLGLSGRRLRDAIVLVEVLGPPKGLARSDDPGASVWRGPIA